MHFLLISITFEFYQVAFSFNHLIYLLFGVVEVGFGTETFHENGVLIVYLRCEKLGPDQSSVLFLRVACYLHLRHDLHQIWKVTTINRERLTCHFWPFFETPRYIELRGPPWLFFLGVLVMIIVCGSDSFCMSLKSSRSSLVMTRFSDVSRPVSAFFLVNFISFIIFFLQLKSIGTGRPCSGTGGFEVQPMEWKASVVVVWKASVVMVWY